MHFHVVTRNCKCTTLALSAGIREFGVLGLHASFMRLAGLVLLVLK